MKAEMVIIVVAIVLLGIPTVPSVAQGDTTGRAPLCLASISSGCDVTDAQNTAAQLPVCCAAVKGTISNDIDCFCLIKPYLNLDDPSHAYVIESFLTYCGISGTFDTLCPGSTSNPSHSPSGSSSSTTGGTLLPSAPGIRRNAGSKIASKFLPSLLIVLICLVIS